jgi:hypothetical protein
MKSRNNNNSLHEIIIDICNICKIANDETPFKSVSPRGIHIKNQLQLVNEYVRFQFDSKFTEDLDFHFSRGAILYPRVPWVAITNSGIRPNDDLAVTICFARNGDGIVAGLLLPPMKIHEYKTKKRSNLKKFINVNGTNTPTKYNDHFINPQDFDLSNFSEKKLLEHLKSSIELMRTNIKNG